MNNFISLLLNTSRVVRRKCAFEKPPADGLYTELFDLQMTGYVVLKSFPAVPVYDAYDTAFKTFESNL